MKHWLQYIYILKKMSIAYTSHMMDIFYNPIYFFNELVVLFMFYYV